MIAKTILTDVRVLAVDQTFKQDKDTKTVIGKTATLELTPAQAQSSRRGGKCRARCRCRCARWPIATPRWPANLPGGR